jgi:polysaccharide biosynthesis protein PslH
MSVERKILILTNRIPYPLKDGGNLAMNAMIEGYHQAGWKVHLLSMNTTRHHVAQHVLERLYTHLAGFSWVNVNNDFSKMEIIKNFLFELTPSHVSRFKNAAFAEKLEEVIDKFKPDIVQVESVFLSQYLPLIRDNSEALTILRVHNIEYQIWRTLADKTKNLVKRYYLKNLSRRMRIYERESWKQYDLLLPITEKDAQSIHRLETVSYMVVAPFAIDTTHVKITTDRERWVGYHIGAMDWMPNSEAIRWFLHKVWPKVHKKLPQFEFYFAGRDMPKQFNKYNADGVHCMGEVQDAAEFIADKKILIVPLRSGSGVRIKILEAMAAGKVVISTHTGMRGIDARSGEHYIAASKPEQYLKAIRWCLDHKEKAHEMGLKALTLVRSHYEQQVVAGNVIAEIEQLMQVKGIG